MGKRCFKIAFGLTFGVYVGAIAGTIACSIVYGIATVMKDINTDGSESKNKKEDAE